MNKISRQVPFGQAFLTALFAGILCTLVCFAYDIYYRMATYFGPTEYINVSSIIFIVNLLLMTAGVIYYFFKSWSGRGDLIYIIFFLLLTGFCIWRVGGIHRFTDLKLNREFVRLLGGTIIIICAGALSIPWLFHNKKITDLFYEAEV